MFCYIILSLNYFNLKIIIFWYFLLILNITYISKLFIFMGKITVVIKLKPIKSNIIIIYIIYLNILIFFYFMDLKIWI